MTAPPRAMLLAAGRGERLRPLTDNLPKPLIEIGGKPLIVHHIEALRAAGVARLVINLSWLGELIRQRLGDGSELGVSIAYSEEPPGALETAGGIVEALPLLGTAPFIAVSADVFTDYPFERLIRHEAPSAAHLVLVDNPAHHTQGDFALDGDRVGRCGPKRLTFGGIGRFDPSLFAALEPGRRPLRPVLEGAIERGVVTGEHYGGVWCDVGTPARLEAARRARPRAR